MNSIAIALLSFFVFAGCLRASGDLNVLAAIREADAIILYSLDPLPLHLTDENGKPTKEDAAIDRFYGYTVLGKITKPGTKISDAIRAALVETLTNEHHKDEAPYLCFDPRHAVRLQMKNRHIDLLICFECKKGFALYQDGGEQRKEPLMINNLGAAAMNSILDENSIKRDRTSSFR